MTPVHDPALWVVMVILVATCAGLPWALKGAARWVFMLLRRG